MWAAVFVFVHILIIVETSTFSSNNDTAQPMSKEERESLKEESRDMFYHAYRAYMQNAYPADELMPLSCSGRWRGSHASRGDIDDTLGNFSLTLIDTLDTLVILGDITEFEHAVKLVMSSVSFDNDVVVSVFETNIRVLGGLLSGHVLAEYLQQRHGVMRWYAGELLDLAKDLGYRLLPAFNTTTGIPHARINLRHGLKSQKLEWSRETCTACAGTMVLEMAALSRLTGEPIFEEKAHRAMDELWRLRHRSSDLMGTVLNVQSGVWVRRDSGVGAGIDSYYEYCLKAYILLGDDRYLGRFNKHYSAVMKYISRGPMLLDVHMHRPHTNSRNFMDALLAFWPGLQVLTGDLKPAVETHEMLYQVMQRHNFIPEAFTTDFQVHWGQHPLRPEFLESTYFLHRATGDPYYLNVGKHVLKALQKYARVPCGYAAVKDVRTGLHEDRMDSFVLAETFKYLFLIFAEPEDLVVDLDEFLFTTEAHLLPLSLARSHSNVTVFSITDVGGLEESENWRQCPSPLRLFPESVRRPLRNLVDGICPRNSQPSSAHAHTHASTHAQRKLLASQFQSGNEEHMKLVNDMGITVATLADGRVQLLHSFSNAKSVQDAEEGLLFMQEMVDISKSQAAETQPQTISFMNQGDLVNLNAGPAHFGRQLRGSDNVSARVGVANPLRACDTLTNPEWLRGRIAIVERGDCMFVEKARRLMLAGAVGGIVVDNSPESSAGVSPMFAMSGDGTDDVTIPLVFLFSKDAWKLLQALAYDPTTIITMSDHHSEKADSKSDIPEKKEPIQLSTLQQIKGSVQNFLFNDDSSDAQTSSSDDQRPIGKQQASEMGGGEGGGQGSSPSIRISRRDAYLSSEGTTVVPPFYREHLRKLLLEMLAKPHQAEKWLKQSRDQDDLVQVEVSSTSSSSPSTTPSSSSSSGSSHNLVGIKLPDEL